MITLHNVYTDVHATDFLYDLLKERSSENDPHMNISHRRLPSWGDHVHFVQSFPYRAWYLIGYREAAPDAQKLVWAGYVSATPRNEIGVIISKPYRRMGIARAAIQQFMALHKPLPAVPSVRSGDWLANINPKNEASIKLFSSLGFGHLQNTYSLPGGNHG